MSIMKERSDKTQPGGQDEDYTHDTGRGKIVFWEEGNVGEDGKSELPQMSPNGFY